MTSYTEVFTDGACRGNPGPGGWGVVIRHSDRDVELWGNELNTTNNRMEMTAAIEALQECKRSGNKYIRLYTDSMYLRNGITLWIRKWKSNGWKTSNRKPVKNIDLWCKLDEMDMTIDWKWVKGHGNNEGNQRADFLACNAITDIS